MNTTQIRNGFSFVTSIIAYFFLVPGVYLSMLTINTNETVKSTVGNFHVHIFNTSNSILRTVHDLYQQDYRFVACMIFLFSIIVPVIKALLLTFVFFTPNPTLKRNIFEFVKTIAKWSMCDVFIVAILLAYLSTGSHTHVESHQVSVFIFSIDVNVAVKMKAQLEIGFYCFLTYCLLSLIALQLYKHPEIPMQK